MSLDAKEIPFVSFPPFSSLLFSSLLFYSILFYSILLWFLLLLFLLIIVFPTSQVDYPLSIVQSVIVAY